MIEFIFFIPFLFSIWAISYAFGEEFKNHKLFSFLACAVISFTLFWFLN
jgi:hypothetical protein